jgi:hypothetical protein
MLKSAEALFALFGVEGGYTSAWSRKLRIFEHVILTLFPAAKTNPWALL